MKLSRTEASPHHGNVAPSLALPPGRQPRQAVVVPVLLAALLVVYPAVALNWRGSANGILFVFTLVGLFHLAALQRPFGGTTRDRSSQHWQPWPSLGMLAMAGIAPLVVAGANEIARGVWVPKNLDLPLRFALLGPCTAAALQLRVTAFRHLQWGLIAGALISMVRVVYLNRLGARAAEIGVLNTIPFSDISLMLGFLSMLSLGWSITGSRMESGLKILGFAAGVVASFVSGSRGGWVAIPILALICGIALRACQSGNAPPLSRQGWLIRCVGVVVLLAVGVRIGAARVGQALADIRDYLHGNVDTSIGTRFEVWRASWMALRDHPLLGVGFDGFKPAVAHYVQAGRVSTSLIGLPHSHNELLFALASGGLAGGLALLAVYLLPLIYFCQAMRSLDRETRCAAGMGATIVAGYAISGLTETFFIISMNTAIYVFLVGVLLAFVHTRRICVAVASSPMPS